MTEAGMQAEYWDGPGGERWVQNRKQLDRAIKVFGERALEQLAPQLGERVLDVGCGAGTSTLALAEAVGAGGHVTGLDISEALLGLARERGAHLKQVEFLRGDASVQELPPEFDVMFSRFGMMFFDSPRQAFANLRKALRPGGNLSFVCWQGQEQNPWSHEPLKCVLPFLEEAPPALVPNAPGPLAFADPDYLESELRASGWREIEIRDLSADVVLGSGGVQGALDFSMQVGPASRLTGDLGPEAMQGIRESLATLFQGALKDDVVSLPGASWVVSARS